MCGILNKIHLNNKLLITVVVRKRCTQNYLTHMQKPGNFDLAIVGGGIIGVATARELKLRHRSLKIALLEKEARLGTHQSSHNAGMIHAEYKPDASKIANRLCTEGCKLIYEYCEKKSIPYKKCGKLIVATDEFEVLRLKKIFETYKANKMQNIKFIGKTRIKEIEPNCNGVNAIWSPENGIVDWQKVTQSLGNDFKGAGGKIFCNFKVENFVENHQEGCSEYPVLIHGASETQNLACTYVLTCAGLQSDHLSHMTGCAKIPRIVPFRGEYMRLKTHKKNIINTTIYPVTDAQSPSLGVHLTPRMDGGVLVGPHVVLALAREGYSWSDINAGEFLDALRYPGFLRLTAKHLRFGISEMIQSASLPLQMNALQKLVPSITKNDLTRGPVGVRAQALSPDGELIDDFIFDKKGTSPVAENVLHCRNTPAPGATNSLAAAKVIADKVENEFEICSQLGSNKFLSLKN